MSVLLAFAAAFLFATGTYLLLQRRLSRILIGVGLIGHGSNILLLTSGTGRGVAPIIGTADPTDFADPLPQALALTGPRGERRAAAEELGVLDDAQRYTRGRLDPGQRGLRLPAARRHHEDLVSTVRANRVGDGVDEAPLLTEADLVDLPPVLAQLLGEAAHRRQDQRDLVPVQTPALGVGEGLDEHHAVGRAVRRGQRAVVAGELRALDPDEPGHRGAPAGCSSGHQ